MQIYSTSCTNGTTQVTLAMKLCSSIVVHDGQITRHTGLEKCSRHKRCVLQVLCLVCAGHHDYIPISPISYLITSLSPYKVSFVKSKRFLSMCSARSMESLCFMCWHLDKAAGGIFDVVILDPPYMSCLIALVTQALRGPCGRSVRDGARQLAYQVDRFCRLEVIPPSGTLPASRAASDPIKEHACSVSQI